MPLTYQCEPASSCNTQLRRASLLLVSCLCLLSAGCLSAVPQYVRGDVAARSSAPISRGASYYIAHPHFADFEDRAIAAQLDQLLRDSLGLQPASAAEADIWIDFSHTISDGGDAPDSDSASSWDESRSIFGKPSTRSRRFAIEVSRPERPHPRGAEAQVLWRGEVLTDGAQRELSSLADPYLRRILSGFGREVSATSFSFRVNDPAAEKNPGRASVVAGPLAPALPTRSGPAPKLDLPGAKEEEAVALPTPEPEATRVEEAAPLAETAAVPVPVQVEEIAPLVATPAVAPEPEPTVVDATRVVETIPEPPKKAAAPRPNPGREPTSMIEALFGGKQPARPPARPAPVPERARPPAATPAVADTAASSPAPSSKPPQILPLEGRPTATVEEFSAAREYAEVGPTWRDASSLCERLSERSDLQCSLYVEVGSSAPHLELDYATADDAAKNWQADAKTVGGAFCITAARHGLYGSAVVIVRAEGSVADRKCKDLPR